MTDDAVLLRRYADAHTEDVFGELVRRHLGVVYSAALRRVGGDTHLAEDVAQVVFTELACNAARLSRHPLLTGWLYATTRNAAANIVRTERRRKLREQEAHVMNDILSESGPETDWSRVAPVLDEAIDQLTEVDRTAVLLRFVEQRAFAEIGAAVRLSEDAARMRVERALDKLRVLLGRRGIRSSAAALGVALANHAVVAAPAGLAASVTGAAVAATPFLGATTAAGLLGFMSTTKLVFTGVAVAVLISVLVTTSDRGHAAEMALAAQNRDYVSREVRLQDLEKRVGFAEQESARLKASVEETRAAAAQRAAAEADAAQRAAAWDPGVEGRAFLARHPDVRSALMDHQTAKLRSNYAALFRSLNLSESQIDRFVALRLGGTGFPYGPGGKVLMLSLSANRAPGALEHDLQELLGETGFERYQQFEKAASARDITSGLARALAFSDTPLTAGQSVELAQIVAENRIKKSAGSVEKFDWNIIEAKAEAILSKEQRGMLASVRVQYDLQQVANGATYGVSPVSSPAK